MTRQARCVGLMVLAVGAGCYRGPAAGPVPVACPPGHASLVRDALYFGLTEPSGRLITEAEWETFLAKVVTPAFPAGFTVLSATGQWRGADSTIVREPSRVLVLFHPAATSADGEIRTVIEHYRGTFNQEAVLWERSLACTAF